MNDLETACPPLEQIANYARRALSEDLSRILEHHLSTCHPCMGLFRDQPQAEGTVDVPNCRIVSELGRGRFGVVYKAWWLTEQPRLVALKLLSYPGDMERHRFDREIQVLKKLHSPGIVRCLDSGPAGDRLYYIMDLIEGAHLDEYLKNRNLTLFDKLAVFQKVCVAVADAHAAGVVHRDLKPRNILVDTENRPHVLDFGICSVDHADWSGSLKGTITHRGDVIGTLRYMSPEQAWGGVAGEIDARSDVWALGIMLHEIATEGAYPYSLRDTPEKPPHEALLDRIRRELPRLPRLRHLDRGRDLETLIERCLAWEARHRLPGAAPLADDLERYIHCERIQTKPLSIGHRARRLAIGAVARSRWPFWSSFVAIALVASWFLTFVSGAGWTVSLSDGRGVVSGHSTWRDEARVIGVMDESVPRLVEFAHANGLDSVSKDTRTWRPVHIRLLHRLRDAPPRLVLWDYYFQTPQPDDAALADAINTLERAGAPVVLAAATFDEDGRPVLSDALLQHLPTPHRFGAIVARDMVERPGEFVLAVRQASSLQIIPSITLAAVAAIHEPTASLEIEWWDRRDPLLMLYRIDERGFLRKRDRIETTRAFEAGAAADWLQPGDLVATATLPLDDPAHWERRTLRYEEVLFAEDQELHRLVGGRVVVIGDLRTRASATAPDRHRVLVGGEVRADVPGCYLLADSLVALLDGRVLRLAWPPSGWMMIGVLAAALTGCVVPARAALWRGLESPTARRAIWLALGATLLIATTALWRAHHPATVGIALCFVAAAISLAGSFAVEFARNRHRRAERARQAIEGFGFSSGGTITLPARSGRSRSDIR